MKLIKTVTDDKLVIERKLYRRSYSLTLDKKWCVGCGICQEVCPTEAIELKKIPKVKSGKACPPIIEVSAQECIYCGICESICPFGALTLMIDGEHKVPVAQTESFPQLVREIKVDMTKCMLVHTFMPEAGCVECERVCPFGLIKIEMQSKNKKLDFIIDKTHCPCCRICEIKCPYNLLHVKKIFRGTTKINHEKCPESCRDCLDVCPISGALYLSENGKVDVNELLCVYCGVCSLVCPVEGALQFHRTSVHHTPIHSGAWNAALEKLTTTKDVAKELQAKSLKKIRGTVERRLLSKKNHRTPST